MSTEKPESKNLGRVAFEAYYLQYAGHPAPDHYWAGLGVQDAACWREAAHAVMLKLLADEQPKKVPPPPPDKWSIRALDAATEGYKQTRKQIAAYSAHSDINPPPHYRELQLLTVVVFNALAAAFSEWERQDEGYSTEVQP